GPSLVHRRAVSPRTEVAAVRAASAVRVVHPGGGGAEPAGVDARRIARGICNKPSCSSLRAKRSNPALSNIWIASSLSLLAMTETYFAHSDVWSPWRAIGLPLMNTP